MNKRYFSDILPQPQHALRKKPGYKGVAMPGTRLSSIEKKLQRQWDNGEYPWPTLRGIQISGDKGLRGLNDVEISIKHPVSVIIGKNCSGKSTLLALASLGFHSPAGFHSINAQYREDRSYYTFVNFFFKGPKDPDITGLTVTWLYDNQKPLIMRKQSSKWIHYERRPERPVHFIGISRAIPAVESSVLRSHFRPAQKTKNQNPLNREFRERVGEILGREYTEASVYTSAKYSLRTCTTSSDYSSFNMGSGEDILISLFSTIQGAPKGSLVVIEEIEVGLHPEALRILARHLQEIALKYQIQFIVSSHSADFIDALPRRARILIQRHGEHRQIVEDPTTIFAVGDVTGRFLPELIVYCEDILASSLIKKAIHGDTRKRVQIIPVGSYTELANQLRFHARIGAPQKPLMIYDGDVSTNDIFKAIESLYLDSSIDDSMINWAKMASDVTPEKWIINQLDCEDGYRLLCRELRMDGKSHEMAGILQYLKTLRDAHECTYQFKERLSLEDEREAVDVLTRAFSNLTSDPLREIRDAIECVLAGKRYDGFYCPFTSTLPSR